LLGGGGARSILEVKLVAKLNISLFLEDGLLFFSSFSLVIFWVMGDTKEGSFFSFFFLLGVWGPQIGKLSFLCFGRRGCVLVWGSEIGKLIFLCF